MGGTVAACTTALTSNVVLITHCHTDHAMAIFSHARAREIAYNKPTTYLVPSGAIDALTRMKDIVKELDRGNDKPGEAIDAIVFVPCDVNDEINVTNLVKKNKSKGSNESDEGVFVQCFPVKHIDNDSLGRPLSLGYVVSTRSRTPGLLPQYKSLSKTEIKALRTNNVPLTNPALHSHALVAYSGDTCATGLIRTPDSHPNLLLAYTCSLILMEVTYIGPADDTKSIALAAARNHVHSSHLKQIFPQGLEAAQKVVAVHSSLRHGASERVRAVLSEFLPSYLKGSVGVINNEWWGEGGAAAGSGEEESVLWL